MRRVLVFSLFVCPLAAIGAIVLAQQPAVQNAVQDMRPVTSLARDIAGTGGEPAWIGWQVPMVGGNRDLCSTWTNNDQMVRGTVLEGTDAGRQPAFAAPAGPVALEAGTNLVLLARVVDGKIERLRTLTGDCPVDAGGRRLTWLSGVTPAASLEYLRTLATPTLVDPSAYRRLADTAVTAIALHQNASAGPVLVELASRGDDTHVRDLALQWLGRTRGSFGFDYLTRTLTGAREPGLRRQLVTALGRTRESGTASALLAFAQSDPDEHVRSEALSAFAILAPGPTDVTAILVRDRNGEVRSRGVSGLLRRASRDGVPALIALARGTEDIELRKEIVRGLSRVDDARAVAYLEELVRR